MKCVVIGGGGFLGKALCKALRARGDEVISISRGNYPELEALGVSCLQHDISKPLLDCESLESADVVFHTAAKVSMWGKYYDFYRINVIGTQNIIAACKKFGIKHLVYTSSPSVIADGSNLIAVNESYPYPKKHIACYPQTKMLAEQSVLQERELYTLALRPHLIWGPNDTNLVPTILDKARKKKLVRLGSGNNLVDITFIEDCVAAHLCAAQALRDNPACRGKAYFISQGEPIKLWAWIDDILERHNLSKVTRSVPYKAVYTLAAWQEFLAKLKIMKEPIFTRFLISEMVTDHYFDISAAKNELGFCPKWSIAEAMDKTFGKKSK